MKKKNGFTLIELLAVIVILAIILVIAVPQIMNSIEKSRKGSIEASARLVANAIETLYQASQTIGEEFSLSGDCMEFGSLDTNEYGSCTYTIDSNGKAKVTLKGKSGGKFDSYVCKNATKTTATCESITSYVITLDANGGTVSTSSLSIEPGSAYGNLPTPTLTDSLFDGWYTAISGGVKVSSTDIPTESVTLYARWITSVSFATDSWETIAAIVKAGEASSKYSVGDTKEINLGDLGTHTVRIANMSSDWEHCGSTGASEGYSQSACGFVVEFADIITTHNMNSTNINNGGWASSSMRTYINGEIDSETKNINYSSTIGANGEGTIYNAIKDVTGDIIADTVVVSGYGDDASANYVTTDKVYILSKHEVFNSNSDYDTAYDYTRQLDYYVSHSTQKSYNSTNTNWWIRNCASYATGSFYRSYHDGFGVVQSNGNYGNEDSSNTYGVSVAFRIA